MHNLLNSLLVLVLVMNLFALGNSRLNTVIRIVAGQGVLIGMVPLLLHTHLTFPVILTVVAAIALKGFVIPGIMFRSLRAAQIKREVEPLIGLLPSIVLGAVATALALLFSGPLAAGTPPIASLLIPTSFATIFAGFILLTARYKAISQVVGYLVLENGIFIFGMLLVEAIPLVVEMGMLLDLFVGIFVISIITNHINQAFSSMDTRRLSSLKE
jgi:hydrogenase-4 component E